MRIPRVDARKALEQDARVNRVCGGGWGGDGGGEGGGEWGELKGGEWGELKGGEWGELKGEGRYGEGSSLVKI